MSSANKDHLKSLKQPDQFQVKAMAFMDFLLKNIKVLVGVLAVAAVIVGGVYAVRGFQNKARDGRLDELGKVQIVYEAEQKKAQTEREVIQKQIEALAATAPKKPEIPGVNAVAEPPQDPKMAANIEALTKKAQAIKANHVESAQKFQEFLKKYDSTPEGWMAGLQSARLTVDEGKPADAVPLLDAVLEKSKGNQFYQVQARLALVSILEDQGNFDKALTEVDALDKVVDKDMKPRVLLAKGRIQLLKNQKTEAKATFNSLIEQHGTSPEAQKARSIESLIN